MCAALQGQLKMQIPMRHPLMQWRMDNAASVMDRYVARNEDLIAYDRLHGRRANSKAIEFRDWLREQQMLHINVSESLRLMVESMD